MKNYFLKENKPIIKKMLLLFRPYIKNVVIVVSCMALSAGINTLIPLLSKQIVDNGLLGDNFNILVKFVAASFLLVVADQGMGIIETKFRVYISSMMPYELLKTAFKHTMKLDIKYFNNTNFAEIMNNINMDINNISRISDRSLFFVVSQILKIAGGLVGLFIIDWELAFLVLIIVPVKYVIVKMLAKKRLELFKRYMEMNRQYSAWYGDTVSGIKEVKLSGIDRIKTGQFIRKQREIVKLNIKMNILDKINEVSESFLFQAITGLLYIVGGYLVFHERLTVGGLIAFITYCIYVTAPISAVLNIGYNFSNILPSAKRFFEFMELKCEEDKNTKKGKRIRGEFIKGNIKYENVSFSYDKKSSTLKNVNFEIKNGEKIVVIGANGSGKTTLINLFLRFLRPSEGKILVDGIDISTVPLRDYRRLISVVSQDIYLF